MSDPWRAAALVTLISLMGVGCEAERAPAMTESRVDTLPFYDTREFTPRWHTPEELPSGFHQIPTFSLMNQLGNSVTEKDLDGKVTVVDFFFSTCSGICPKLQDNMFLVENAFAQESDLLILSHSVTPEKDSVEVLQMYASRRGVNSARWHLLTGDRAEIYTLAREGYFADEDLGEMKGPDDFLHTESFLLLDRRRHLRGIYNGLNKTSVQQLITDAKMLLAEPLPLEDHDQ